MRSSKLTCSSSAVAAASASPFHPPDHILKRTAASGFNNAGIMDHEGRLMPSAKQSAQIRDFCAARSISDNDANSKLLNEAVRIFNESDHGDSRAEADDVGGSAFDLLRDKMEKLEESCKKFQSHLSQKQRIQLANAPNKTQGILGLIDMATLDWCKSSQSGNATANKVKDSFHRICTSMDQHSVLLTMLPKDHEYVTVFFGTFKSIVAASIMHQAMAVGLPKIVDELNSIVSDVAKKISLFPQATSQIRRTLIELYTRVFDLFAKLMKWYTSKRKLWKLLKRDCYGDFEKLLQEIRIWSDAVTRETWNNFALESRLNHDQQQEFLKRLDEKLEALNKYHQCQRNADVLEAIQRAHLLRTDPTAHHDLLADSLVNKLLRRFHDVESNQTQTLLSMSETSSLASGSPTAMVDQDTDFYSVRPHDVATQSLFTVTTDADAGSQRLDEDSLRIPEQRSREDIERCSRALDDWYSEGDMHPLHLSQRPKVPPFMHESISTRIVEWVRSTESRALCIQLAYSVGSNSFGGSIASYVVSSAWEADYPTISHFCSLPRTGVDPGRSPETIALCAMMASLIRQLIMILPDSLPESAADMDKARFARLDGTLRTWGDMISLFTELLSLVPGSTLIVIHGLQLLDHKDTMGPIEKFLAAIRNRMNARDQIPKQIVKALFVTEGQARAVVPWLDVQRGEYLVHNAVQNRIVM
ncbi:hypothetical protein Q7P37_007092 [Cladosporium fusiforme]